MLGALFGGAKRKTRCGDGVIGGRRLTMAVAVSFIPRFVAFKGLGASIRIRCSPLPRHRRGLGNLGWLGCFGLRLWEKFGRGFGLSRLFLDWLGDGVTAKTAKGDIQAKCAVITVSTAIIAEQLLRFNPPLPDEFLSAAQSLPMGNYKHLYAVMPVRGESFNAQQCFAGEELYMKIRPLDILCQRLCRRRPSDEMDAWTEPELHAFLRDACGHILGNDAAQKLGAFKTSHWRQSQWVRGAYAAAVPGDR